MPNNIINKKSPNLLLTSVEQLAVICTPSCVILTNTEIENLIFTFSYIHVFFH